MTTAPSLKDRPLNPMPTLPIPKRKGVAVAVIAIPMGIGLVIGWLIGITMPFIAPFLPASIAGYLLQPNVRGAIMLLSGAAGGALGLQTLITTLAYGSTEKKSDSR